MEPPPAMVNAVRALKKYCNELFIICLSSATVTQVA